MNRPDFLRLLDTLLDVPPGTLQGPEELQGYDTWDSMGLMEYMTLVDKHFGVRVAPALIEKAVTVDDLVALVGDRIVVSPQ